MDCLGRRHTFSARQIDDLADVGKMVKFSFPIVPHHQHIRAMLTQVFSFQFKLILDKHTRHRL